MKTKSLIAVIAIFIFGVVFFSSCKNGKEEQPKNVKEKVLTVYEALDTCFTEFASFSIRVDSIAPVSLERKKPKNHFYFVYPGTDAAAKEEKTAYGYKRVHIYQLKYDMKSWELYAFMKNHNGQAMTIKDMVSLHQQCDGQLPVLAWILGGDYYVTEWVAAMQFLNHDPEVYEGPYGEFIPLGSSDKIKWRAKVFYITYWDELSAEY